VGAPILPADPCSQLRNGQPPDFSDLYALCVCFSDDGVKNEQDLFPKNNCQFSHEIIEKMKVNTFQHTRSTGHTAVLVPFFLNSAPFGAPSVLGGRAITHDRYSAVRRHPWDGAAHR